MQRLATRIALGSCLMVLTANADATLITFDRISECCTYPNLAYSESGYTFTLLGSPIEGPLGWHLGDGTSVPGTLNWHGREGSNVNLQINLTKQDGGLFDLIELDLDFFTDEHGGLFAISAAGYGERTFGVSLLDEEVLVRIEDQPLRFFGVSEVIFRHLGGIGVGIDNVRVKPHQVTEPGALSLLVIILAGLGFTRRCKQQPLA